MLNDTIIRAYTDILKEELLPAMGCTEPIAIAYAASILRDALEAEPDVIRAGFSGNIIKNIKSVIVPATCGMKGAEVALAAGIIANAYRKQLEVLCGLSENDRLRIRDYINSTKIDIYKIETDSLFEVDIQASADNHVAHVRLSGGHTQIALVERDGEDITSRYITNCVQQNNEHTPVTDRSLLNVEDIVDFADTVDLTELRPYIQRQIDLNMAIAEEGLGAHWGASIGRLLFNEGICDTRAKARAYAAAASDARMSGCEMPVCILSGSGNQGITASVPVVVYAKDIGADEETTIRALIVSDLITLHQKTGIGCLSAYCGAISAGCGCGTGICYLLGGRYREIAHTLVNSVAILSGTICDGAKPSCAAKIAMAVEAGIMGYDMFRAGQQFRSGDGIVSKGVENTIKNIGRLARNGMKSTDKEIIDIMLEI